GSCPVPPRAPLHNFTLFPYTTLFRSVEERLRHETARPHPAILVDLAQRLLELLEFWAEVLIQLATGVVDEVAKGQRHRADIFDHSLQPLRADNNQPDDQEHQDVEPTDGRKHASTLAHRADGFKTS